MPRNGPAPPGPKPDPFTTPRSLIAVRPPMSRQPSTSSAIASIGFQGTLEIEFRDGDGPVYRYFDVPWRVFDGLRSAESQGRYLHEHIRGKYRFEKV